MKRALTLAGLCWLGCSSRVSTPDAQAVGASADAAVLVAPPAPVRRHHGLDWYEDAPEAALAAAKAGGKLVFVDMWASWCHTCLSMREFVLTAERLAPVQEQLVFLAIDTENAHNAALLARLPIGAWPTFYLLDGDGAIFGRWVGAASAEELVDFARDGLRAADTARGSALSVDDPLSRSIAGDRRMAAGDPGEAAAQYRAALAASPANWARRPDTLLALATSLHKLDRAGECVDLGIRELTALPATATASDFCSRVLTCAAELPERDARVKRVRALAKARLHPLCFEAGPRMSADDRADACGILRDLAERLHDAAGVRAALLERLSIATRAAAGLPDAVARTYDPARVDALLALGRADEAIALLEARERALPDDYNAPHYLARVLRDAQRYDQALPAVERALSRVSGPRRAGILGVKADILLGAGRKDDALRVLEEQLAAYRSLPAGQAQPARMQAVADRLVGLR